jgi:AcrR family transcriptional regulator
MRKVQPGEPRLPARARGRYHHGNLKQALIDAAVELAGEGGPEKVTVREAARRVGVSSGAPFRHFASRTALMTAVAEQAMVRFRAEIDAALRRAPPEDPLRRVQALAHAFLLWALRNPTHFRIISSRRMIDFDASPALRHDFTEFRDLELQLLRDLAPDMKSPDLALLALTSRALVYGVARMRVDGQFAQWGVAERDAERTALAAADLFTSLLSAAPAAARSR